MAKNHEVVRTGKLDEQTSYESGETDTCVRKLSENYREHPQESIGLFGRPAEYIAYDQLKIFFLRAQFFFSTIVGLTAGVYLCFYLFSLPVRLCCCATWALDLEH